MHDKVIDPKNKFNALFLKYKVGKQFKNKYFRCLRRQHVKPRNYLKSLFHCMKVGIIKSSDYVS